MAMKASMTAKDWLYGLNPEQLKRVCSLTAVPTFTNFLVGSDVDMVTSAQYAAQCNSVGVPIEYTSSPEALHYLTVAIANYLKGNA